MKFNELHKQPEGQNLEFKTSFGRETVETVTAFSNRLKPEDLLKGDYVVVHRNKLLAEAFYLRGDIEKFGTGYYRIQTEMKNYPEIQFSFELMDGFMRCTLGVAAQDDAQDTHQDKHLSHNAIGHDRLGDKLGDTQDTPQDKHLSNNAIENDRFGDTAQDTAQVRELIMNVEGELNREDIQKKLKLTHRENFRKFYLKPALESGLIEMTIPGKPNSKHQKYRLTEKGKQMKKEAKAFMQNSKK